MSKPSAPPPQPQIDMSQYVLKSDHNKVVSDLQTYYNKQVADAQASAQKAVNQYSGQLQNVSTELARTQQTLAHVQNVSSEYLSRTHAAEKAVQVEKEKDRKARVNEAASGTGGTPNPIIYRTRGGGGRSSLRKEKAVGSAASGSGLFIPS